MKKLKFILFVLTTFLFLYAGSCSSYHIDGYIETSKTEIYVNEPILLEAVVTDEVTPFDVLWGYYPDSDSVKFLSPVVFNNDTTKYKAWFSSSEPGDYTIYLTFLYKNTGPKPSDTLVITVQERQ